MSISSLLYVVLPRCYLARLCEVTAGGDDGELEADRAARDAIARTRCGNLGCGSLRLRCAAPEGSAVSYILMYRTREGRQRRFTIGRHGAPWTPDTAREEAQRLLGKVVSGADPAADKREAREAMTVAELCDAYLADAEPAGC